MGNTSFIACEVIVLLIVTSCPVGVMTKSVGNVPER